MDGSFSPHVEASFKIAGAIATLVGAVMLLAAVGLILAPELLRGLLEQAAGSIKDSIPGR